MDTCEKLAEFAAERMPSLKHIRMPAGLYPEKGAQLRFVVGLRV